MGIIVFGLLGFFLAQAIWEWYSDRSSVKWAAETRQRDRRTQGEIVWKGEVLASGIGPGKTSDDDKVLDMTVACLAGFLKSKVVPLTDKAPLTLRIAYAIVPGGASLYETVVFPRAQQSAVEKRLTEWMADWPMLPVAEPLALAITAHLRGGVLEEVEFPPVFQDLQARASLLPRIFRPAPGSSAQQARPLGELLRQQLGPGKGDQPVALQAEHFERCLKRLPGHRDLLLARGVWRTEHDEFEAGIEDLSAVIAQEPGNATAYFWRAVGRANLGRFVLAMSDAEKALHLQPKVWGASDLLVRMACHQDQLDRAIEVATEALSRHPEVANLYHSRGRAWLQKKAPAQAEEDFTKAIQFAPEWADLFLQRAVARFQLSQAEAARADLAHWESLTGRLWEARKKRLTLLIDFSQWSHGAALAADLLAECPDAEKSELHTLRGYCLANEGKLEMAIEEYSTALQLNSQNYRAHAVRAIALVQSDAAEEAAPDADAALEAGVAVARMRWVRAAAKWAANERQAAIDEMALAVEADPEDDFSKFWYARLLSHDEQLESARDVLRSIKPENEDSEVRWLRGNILADLGDRDAAWKDMSLAAAEKHCPPEVLLGRARLALERGDLATADEDLSRLLTADEDNYQALCVRGQVRFHQHRRDLAIADYLRAEQVGPKVSELGQLLLQALVSEKRFDEAREKLAEYQAEHPETPGWGFIAADLEVKQHGPGAGDELLRSAIASHPEHAARFTVELLLSEAAWEHDAENYEGAYDKCSEALEHDPESWPRILPLRSTNAWYSGQYVEALDDLNRLASSGTPEPWLLSARGHIQCEQGEYEAALADLDAAVKSFEDQGPSLSLAYSLNGRGRALGGLGRFDEAWRDLERSIELAPENAWVHFSAGLVYTQQGRADWAAHCFALSLRCTSPRLPPHRRQRVERLLKRETGGKEGGEG
jgi:tetratricopeptide (TPR) repeat protein